LRILNKTREKASKTSEEEINSRRCPNCLLNAEKEEGPDIKWVINPQLVA
jgi:hypothetical protein